jgi:hypothetical protein
MLATLMSRAVSPHQFKIIRCLPERGGEFQYRVKCAQETFERVVFESAMQKV